MEGFFSFRRYLLKVCCFDFFWNRVKGKGGREEGKLRWREGWKIVVRFRVWGLVIKLEGFGYRVLGLGRGVELCVGGV